MKHMEHARKESKRRGLEKLGLRRPGAPTREQMMAREGGEALKTIRDLTSNGRMRIES